MSLMHELDDCRSPLSSFLAWHLPQWTRLADSYRQQLPPGPDSWPQAAARCDDRMPGRAVARRLRVALGASVDGPLKAGVVLAAADITGACGIRQAQAVLRTGRGLIAELSAQPPAGRGPMRLAAPAEERLAQLCCLAARFEEVYQSGLHAGSPLFEIRPGDGLDQALAHTPAGTAADITAQVELADRCGALQRLLETPEPGVRCGPLFAGSHDVDGTNAHFLAAGRLVDCESTADPLAVGRAELYRLASYLLLDYDDTFAIERVGLYLTRYGVLIEWETARFLRLLGARQSLPDLRAACRRALTGCACCLPAGTR